MRRSLLRCSLCLLLFASQSRADGPQDNLPDQVRRIPKLGIEVPASERAELEQGLGRLQSTIDMLRQKKDPATRRWFRTCWSITKAWRTR